MPAGHDLLGGAQAQGGRRVEGGPIVVDLYSVLPVLNSWPGRALQLRSGGRLPPVTSSESTSFGNPAWLKPRGPVRARSSRRSDGQAAHAVLLAILHVTSARVRPNLGRKSMTESRPGKAFWVLCAVVGVLLAAVTATTSATPTSTGFWVAAPLGASFSSAVDQLLQQDPGQAADVRAFANALAAQIATGRHVTLQGFAPLTVEQEHAMALSLEGLASGTAGQGVNSATTCISKGRCRAWTV